MELSTTNYDFAGWATRSGKLCSDGRTIMPDAFKDQDGAILPLVWNHQHNDPNNVLGKALVHSRDGGMYAYCQFNDTESGQVAKSLVQHGDVCALSIHAGQLKHNNNRGVTHGKLIEVSLVLAGANPGAYIDSVIRHGEESEEEAVMWFVSEPESGEKDLILHSGEEQVDDATENTENTETAEDQKETKEDSTMDETMNHSDDGKETEEKKGTENETKSEDDETLEDVFNTLNEKQKTAVYIIVDQAVKDATSGKENDDKIEHSETTEGGNNTMKTNVFDQNDQTKKNTLTHADQETIVAMAKTSGVGSLQEAISLFLEDKASNLEHGFEDGAEGLDLLFPEFKNLNPGAPELIKNFETNWVMSVINKIHKSPYSRIRTRQADARVADLRAKGYQKKGDEKKVSDQIKMITRTTDPQTVYRKDTLHRDDIIDITDFDPVNYQWNIMKDNMYEELALAALVGDRRDDGDPDKIHETHIRSIWNDDDFYTIHQDVDIEAAKATLQGTNTGANFGENYIYAEAMITAALYSREKFKGSGTPDLYCAPHLVNVMLLARDLNGRRIYDSKADLAKALNVNAIHEIEQLEGLERTTKDGAKKKLLGLFVNLSDYTFGSTKGGELTRFEDFDIDFNQYKYLMETRLSGALTKPFAAIALEEPVDGE